MDSGQKDPRRDNTQPQSARPGLSRRTSIGPEVDLVAVIEGCNASHRRLEQTLRSVDDAAARSPSLLKDWSVGHVLTHIARNAQSHTLMLKAALLGQSVEQYPGGHEQRARDIEEGSSRSASELVDDVTHSAAELQETWRQMTPSAWQGHGLSRGRSWACSDMPFHRWREVEIHHVDMGLGYTPADWPEDYAMLELGHCVVNLVDRVEDRLERRLLLAWLVGRATQPELHISQWQYRPADYFKGI